MTTRQSYLRAKTLQRISDAGDNAIHRQCIKRKVERWRRKYAALPAAERRAIMAGLMEIETGD